MKKMRKMKRFSEGGSSYTGDDPIVKYRMGKMSADEANIALGRPDMVKGSLSQEEEKTPTRSMTKPAEPAAEPAKPAAEPAKTTSVKLASNINPEDGKEYTPVDQAAPAAPYKDARLVSAPPIKNAAAKKTSSSSSANTSSNKADTKNPYDSDAANAAIKAQANLDSAYTPSKAKAKPKTLQEKRDTREARRKAIDAKTSGMASKDRDTMRKGGSVKMASGGKVSSASKRADGCAVRGKTRA